MEEKEYLTKEEVLQLIKQLKMEIRSAPVRQGDGNLYKFQISLKHGDQVITQVTFNA